MDRLFSFLFVVLLLLLEWRTFRRVPGTIRWAAVLVLACSLALWYAIPPENTGIQPVRQLIRLLEPLVPPQI